jgi:hypothetical protein
MNTIELLIQSATAPDEDAREGQRELKEAFASHGITTSSRYMTFDAPGVPGNYLGEVLRITAVAIPAVCKVLGYWIRSRSGRRTTLEISKSRMKIEAQTAQDVEKILKALKEVASDEKPD